MEYAMWSNAHDALNPGHGRNFKRLGWLAKSLCPGGNFCIRIFDIEFGGVVSTATAYQYSESFAGIPLDMSLNLTVIDNRLRFLQPPRGTFPGSWKAWKSMVYEGRPPGVYVGRSS